MRFDGVRFLITGNTGFIGNWLGLALADAGASIFGFSNKPSSSFTYFSESSGLLPIYTTYADICSAGALESEIRRIQPDYIFHLAAQSKVLDGYSDASNTLDANLLGTYNVFQALEKCETIRGVTVFTTDKVYLPSLKPHVEHDPLGGNDPYSSSKSMADQLSTYFRRWGELNFPITVFRGGNVVGGGDKGQHRLVPDIVKSWLSKEPLYIRNATSVRPWQHVINVVQACMSVANKSIHQYEPSVNRDFNIGPIDQSAHSVREIVELMRNCLGEFEYSEVRPENGLLEDKVLLLDSSSTFENLELSILCDFESSISLTAEWYKDVLQNNESPLDKTLNQIRSLQSGS
jgi:CDP-glucose 4,6-dehydratase